MSKYKVVWNEWRELKPGESITNYSIGRKFVGKWKSAGVPHEQAKGKKRKQRKRSRKK